jgi:hypothetical protein
VIRKLLALVLLAAGPAAADVAVTGAADAPTFIFTTQLHVLTGEVASPRGRRERLVLDIATVTRETLNEKGIEGSVDVTARAADRAMPMVYSFRLPGRAGTLDEGGLIAIDLDECCALHRAYHDAATGERLFETTVPIASLTLEGKSWKRRVAAFVARMDDREDHRAWGQNAIGLVTYAAADRVIRRVLVTAEDEAVARRLRSLDDERTALAWVDGKSGAPIVTVPDRHGVQPELRLHFVTSQIEIRIPLTADDLVVDTAPAGFRLTGQVPLAIAGGWKVATAEAAYWTQSNTQPVMKGRYILFSPERVRSAGSVLDCGHASYEEAAIPPKGLFQGAGMSRHQAVALGLSSSLAPSLTLTCDSGVFTFHRTEDGRWLTAIDNVVYGLERVVD